MRPDHERHDDGFFVLRVGVQSAASAPRARGARRGGPAPGSSSAARERQSDSKQARLAASGKAVHAQHDLVRSHPSP